MEMRRVFIVGDTLFAETLANLLAGDRTIQVAGTTSCLDEALSLLEPCDPDMVIVAGVEWVPDAAFVRFLVEYPDIPILCTDLGTNDVQIVVNRRVSVHNTDDLLAIIAALPKRTDMERP
jgi:DNA-binding NarL/FixJ family response regulator